MGWITPINCMSSGGVPGRFFEDLDGNDDDDDVDDDEIEDDFDVDEDDDDEDDGEDDEDDDDEYDDLPDCGEGWTQRPSSMLVFLPGEVGTRSGLLVFGG